MCPASLLGDNTRERQERREGTQVIERGVHGKPEVVVVVVLVRGHGPGQGPRGSGLVNTPYENFSTGNKPVYSQ